MVGVAKKRCWFCGCEFEGERCPACLQYKVKIGSLRISAERLFSLPDHLRKTLIALAQIPPIPIFGNVGAPADVVAKVTKRSRPIESAYLNQLERMGYVTRERVKRTVLFKVRK